MDFIDSHSHIYSEDFFDDFEEVIGRAKEVGINKILLPNIDVESIEQMRTAYSKYPDYLYPMMGLHPTSVGEDYLNNLKIVKAELYNRSIPYIAVGEIGLDFYWDKTFIKEQIDALKIQLRWADDLKLPVVIHSRDAYQDIYNVLSDVEFENIRGVIHSFTGNIEELNLFLSLPKWYIGINGIVTFKNSNLDEVVKFIPKDRLLIETDAPYLAPVPKRGRRNESAFLINTLQKCATIYGISADRMASITKENTENLFRL